MFGKPGVVACSGNSSSWETEEEGLIKFKVILGYVVNFSPVRTTTLNYVSKERKKESEEEGRKGDRRRKKTKIVYSI